MIVLAILTFVYAGMIQTNKTNNTTVTNNSSVASQTNTTTNSSVNSDETATSQGTSQKATQSSKSSTSSSKPDKTLVITITTEGGQSGTHTVKANGNGIIYESNSS